MKKGLKKAVTMLLMFAFLVSICGCGAPAKVAIEVSETKVEVEVDDKVTVKIENYDELQDVLVEVDDGDIVKAKESNGKITITGLEEGKTKVVVTATNSDDEIVIKVTVVDNSAVGDPGYSIDVPATPEPVEPSNPGGEVIAGPIEYDWYGSYSGYVMIYGTDAWSDQYYFYDDLSAVVGMTDDGRDYFECSSESMDLWGYDWTYGSGYPVFSFWVTMHPDSLEVDVYDEAWILDDNAIYLNIDEITFEDPGMMDFEYDYYDESYGGGYTLYFYLWKD